MGAGRFGELRTQRAADAGAETTLPLMDALQQRTLVRRRGCATTELVRVFELLEKLQRILYTVDAELERIHIPGAHGDAGLAIAAERAAAGEGEVRLIFALAQG